MYKYYYYITEKGPIYVVKEFEKVNGELFPKRMFEFYSHQPVEEYYNYLMFNKENKYLRFGDFEIDNGDFITTNSQMVEISLFQLRNITDGYLRKGVNPAEQTKKIIESGISREEADEALRRKWESKVKSQEKRIAAEKEVAEVVKRLKRRKTNHEIVSRRSNTNTTEEEKKLKTFMYVFGDLFEEEETRY